MHTLKTKSRHNTNFVVTEGTFFVIVTTYGAVSDDKVGVSATLGFWWYVLFKCFFKAYPFIGIRDLSYIARNIVGKSSGISTLITTL